MEICKVTNPTQGQSQQTNFILTIEEKKKLADFFSVLIQIDQRVNITKTYGNKPNK